MKKEIDNQSQDELDETQTMLILACSGLADESDEINSIQSLCNLYEIDYQTIFISTSEVFFDSLKEGKSYDYIYLSSHGNEYGFSNGTKELDIRWTQFGEVLYNRNILKEESLILLSCCRGGLNDVAFDLINFCPHINYVIGPRTSLLTEEVLIGFSVFLFNFIFRGIDPIVACEKVKSATDLRFMCYDRVEVLTEPAYLLREERYEKLMVDLDGDGVKDEILINEIQDSKIVYGDDEVFDGEENLYETEIVIENASFFSKEEIKNFKFVLDSAGEVDENAFDGLIAKNPKLIMIKNTKDDKIVAIGALKNPNENYHSRVFKQSGNASLGNNYKLELGWIVSLIERKGYASKIVEELSKLSNQIYATVRTDNLAMKHVLNKYGYEIIGDSYPSQRRNHSLNLFIKTDSEKRK